MHTYIHICTIRFFLIDYYNEWISVHAHTHIHIYIYMSRQFFIKSYKEMTKVLAVYKLCGQKHMMINAYGKLSQLKNDKRFKENIKVFIVMISK